MDNTTSQVPNDLVNRERWAAALKALPGAVSKMSAEEDPEKLLREILTAAVDLLKASTGSLLVWDSQSDRLCFKVTSDDACETFEGKSMPSDAGIAGWVFTHRQPLVVPDVRQDERFRSELDEDLGRQITSLVAAPLMTKNEALGVIEILQKGTGECFDDLDLDILTALASQASIAIDNMRMADKLRQQRQQLITIEQETYKKLARDLHDGPAQWLAGISMNLEYILRLMDLDTAQAKEELESVRQRLDKTTSQVRNLMFELRPILLESHDLQTALRHYVNQLNGTDNMHIYLDIDEFRMKLEPRTERAIFDIIREAISNVKRHAYTSTAEIAFHLDGEHSLAITIQDNGLGFDPKAVQRNYSTRGSLGMLNMIERAELLGGKLTIDSVPDQGTTVHLHIPLSQEKK